MQQDDFLSTDVDVLIVGMGPVGGALANLLGLQRTRTLVVDRAIDIFKAPRAIALDHEALRILQSCGLREGELDTVAIPEVRMLSPFFGQYGRAVTAGAIDGHPRLVTFYQPQLEALLREHAKADPDVEVALGYELIDFKETARGVEARLRRADGTERLVCAKFLVGADGANSLVRRQLGLEFEGRTYTEDWRVVDSQQVASPINHVEFICVHRRPTPRMVAPGGRQRWEFKLAPGETREQMENPDRVRELLKPWTLDREPVIERIAVYRFHARLVERFQKGRIFLVGDAAHITPPFVGQGLVAGLRDVGNLSWKLSLASRGLLGANVLESYDIERRPHARKIINLARFMGKLVMPANGLLAFLTHGLMSLARRVPRWRRLFENLEIKPPLQYRRGCFVSGNSVTGLVRGRLAPQAWLRSIGHRTTMLSDDAFGPGFAVVGFGVSPEAGASATTVQAWRDLGARFVQIAPRGCSAADGNSNSAWEDVAGTLIPAVVPMGWVAIIRPDRIVLHDGPADRVDEVLREGLRSLRVDHTLGSRPFGNAASSSNTTTVEKPVN
jgi:3-(3-hydroxy-phenyl)propionate hydroxylase